MRLLKKAISVSAALARVLAGAGAVALLVVGITGRRKRVSEDSASQKTTAKKGSGKDRKNPCLH